MGEPAKGSGVDHQTGISPQEVFEAAPDALVVLDDRGEILELNRAAEQLFGTRRDELLGRAFATVVPDFEAAEAVSDRGAAHADGAAHASRVNGRPLPLSAVRADGTRLPVEITISELATPRRRALIAAVRRIPEREPAAPPPTRESRERALYAEMARLVRKDPLTGLPNRALLHDRLVAAIADARSRGTRLAVLFLDIDRFKGVNDALGHAIGDWLLESMALRLTTTVPPNAVVTRHGGDEFIILLPNVRTKDEAAVEAGKILGAVSGLHRFGPHELHVTASVGVTIYPDDAEDSETLIKNADIAMFYAKDHGRNNVQFFTHEMNARIVERQVVENNLRHALRRNEFVLYYQPKVALDSGVMIGAEALLRWRHPDGGIVPPERFVPIAEESGLITPIGQWVLNEACRQSREWQASGLKPVPVAVNVSGIEFRRPRFLDDVRRTLRDTHLDPRYLEVELTESVLMESAGATADVLIELKRLGLGLAVDDFGTGYSSLSYLTRFPIDALKVDQSFVREIGDGINGSPIITAVISMGKSLKHRVIAEGVETRQQLAFLQQQGCEEGQGFHFSRPLTAEKFAELLAKAKG